MKVDELLEAIAPRDVEGVASPASAKLKSKIYSALVHRQSVTGRLLPLTASKQAGATLCIFEEAVAVLPGQRLQTANPCRVCHARILGEHMDRAPIFWKGCPYADFHNH